MPRTRVFIVEDSPVILKGLTQALEDVANAQVVGSAADQHGAIAWLKADENECDVVIVDIFIKAGSGLGVLQGIQASARPPKRVVFTNYLTPAMRIRCQELGADAAFDKSHDIDKLLEWMMTAL